VLVGRFVHSGLPLLCLKVLSFHFGVRLYDIGAVVERDIELADFHELGIVVHKDSLFEDLVEPLAQARQNVTRACVVRKGKHAVGHVERCLVAVSHLETLLVPVDHLEFLCEPLNVPVDVRNLNLGTAHDKATSQVQRWLFTLLDQLLVPIEGV